MFRSSKTRIATTESWEARNPILPNGYTGIEEATSSTNSAFAVGATYYKYKVGDGVTRWNDLGYMSAASSTVGYKALGDMTFDVGPAAITAGKDYYVVPFYDNYNKVNSFPVFITLELVDPPATITYPTPARNYELAYSNGQYITAVWSDRTGQSNYSTGISELVNGEKQIIMLWDAIAVSGGYPMMSGTNVEISTLEGTSGIIFWQSIQGEALTNESVMVKTTIYGLSMF